MHIGNPTRSALVAAATMPLVLLAACGGNAGSGSTSSDEVTVGVIPGSNAAMLYVAQDKGYFKEQGLNVRFEVQQNAAAIVPSVLNGQLSLGTAATTPVVVATSK